MAIRARVELKVGLTHSGHGRKFTKGNPQILTNPTEIKYYQDQAGFSVIVLENKKTKVRSEEPEEPVINDSDVESENSESEEDEDEEDEDEEDEEDYTEEYLEKYKKADLKNIAAEMGLDVNGTKNELIARILDNQ